MGEADQEELKRNGGSWHRGDWKGHGSSHWRMTREAIDLMDNTLIDNINKTVKANDILWHLGDFALGSGYYYIDLCKEYRKRIHCRNIGYIIGNHDKDTIRVVFPNTHEIKELRFGDQKVVLCHYAMAVWNKSHRGSWHLYGHSHSNFEDWANRNMPGRRAIDVGVDNAAKLLNEYRPFSYDEIDKIMSTRRGFTMDHHIDPNAASEEDLIDK